jgi:hypothetical protein
MMPRRIRYTTIACAAASLVSFGVDALFNEDEFFLAGFGFAALAVVLVLTFAFRGRFSGLQRLGAGGVILAALVVVGLLIFAAAMAGFSGIR